MCTNFHVLCHATNLVSGQLHLIYSSCHQIYILTNWKFSFLQHIEGEGGRIRGENEGDGQDKI
jgi:hypothetical protein